MRMHHVRNIVIVLLLVLAACASDDHVGCQPKEISEGTCSIAEEESRNVDIFDDVALSLVQTETVQYAQGVNGFLAQPKKQGKYPGVGHAFANPSGAQYAANETRDAWLKTTRFLKQHLG